MQIRALSIAVLTMALGGAVPAFSAADDDKVAAMIGRMMAGESALQGAELDEALAKAASHPLGSMKNPVRASMPPGERDYLARLRCPDGAAPAYDRQGSGGAGPYGNIVDFYTVSCKGAEAVRVAMDMYHAAYVEERPVPGFTIEPR